MASIQPLDKRPNVRRGSVTTHRTHFLRVPAFDLIKSAIDLSAQFFGGHAALAGRDLEVQRAACWIVEKTIDEPLLFWSDAGWHEPE
jgi:hypothetical protein